MRPLSVRFLPLTAILLLTLWIDAHAQPGDDHAALASQIVARARGAFLILDSDGGSSAIATNVGAILTCQTNGNLSVDKDLALRAATILFGGSQGEKLNSFLAEQVSSPGRAVVTLLYLEAIVLLDNMEVCGQWTPDLFISRATGDLPQGGNAWDIKTERAIRDWISGHKEDLKSAK